MTGLEQHLCNLLQKGLPLCERPFHQMAERLGTTESLVLEAVRQLQHSGILRRIGPVIDARALGKAITLVAAQVPDPTLHDVVQAVNRLPGVSHNYLRRHRLNLWFTLQAGTWQEIDTTLSQMGDQWQIELHSLPARRIFKLDVYFDATGQEPPCQTVQEVPLRTAVELTTTERAMLANLQGGLEITARPFDGLASCPAAQIIDILDGLIRKGVVRRMAGILDHRHLGFATNALLTAEVDEHRIAHVAQVISQIALVSHCYQRDPFQGWPYNLYAMLHCRFDHELNDIVGKISQDHQIGNVALLETVKELKKRPVVHALH